MKMLKMRKGQAAGNVQGFILAVVGIAVVLAVGLIVLAQLQGATTDPIAANATAQIISQLATVPTWIGILITVSLAFIVLSFFSGRQ